jgi:hypothetical protein
MRPPKRCRRNSLRAATLLLALLPLAGGAQSPAESQAARDTEFDGLRLVGASHRGIQFGYVTADMRPSEGAYLCGAMRRDEAAAAASTVASGLSNLPDAALTRLRLRYVVLCGGLSETGRSIGGIPVAPLNLLVLDGSSDSASLEHRTLHELYHLLEYRSGGVSDSEWTGQFGGGYSNRHQALLRRSPVGGGKPGFVNAYAETYAHEDRAELFAYLVLSPREVADLVRRTGDEVLRRKADFLSDKCQRAAGLAIALPR